MPFENVIGDWQVRSYKTEGQEIVSIANKHTGEVVSIGDNVLVDPYHPIFGQPHKVEGIIVERNLISVYGSTNTFFKFTDNFFKSKTKE